MEAELPDDETKSIPHQTIFCISVQFGGVAPKVELELKLKPGINRVKKEAYVRSKYGFQTSSLGEHGLFAVGQMNMDLVAKIANDSDIEKISGVATPASY